MKRKYETTVIIDPLLDQPKTDSIIEKYEEIIKTGGEIIETERWGKKRLAYMINKKPTGYYVHFRYEAEGNVPAELEREFNLNANIMRYLTLQTHKYADMQKELESKKEEKAPVKVEEKKPAKTEKVEAEETETNE